MGLSKILAIFSIISVALASLNSVPAIVWTNNNDHAFQRLPLGRTVQNNEFFGQVKDSLANPEQSVLIFLKNRLSLEDLAQPGTYSNVKSLSANQNSAHYSSIVPVGKSFSKLLGLPVNHVREIGDFSPNHRELTIVHLRNQENSDELVRNVLARLNGAPYTAVFTGAETSEDNDEYESLFGRHLLENNGEFKLENATFLNTSCLLYYSEKISLQVRSNENQVIALYELPQLVDQDYESDCKDNDSSITIKYSQDLPEGLTEFSLRLEFVNARSTWQMVKSVLSFTEKNETLNKVEEMHLFAPFVYAPKNFCYHCALPINITSDKNVTSTTNDNKVRASIIIQGLQVQPSDIPLFKFGRPNDCIGFFTIPIWSGLLVALLLLSVLSFGICMMASMNPIDRFDDPRAKTITVALGD